MTRVFDVDLLLGVPGPGGYALLLTARVDLDLATEVAARRQLGQVARSGAMAVVLDLTGVFIGVAVLRCLRDLAAGRDGAGLPIVTVGAPSWLTMSGLPPVPVADSVDGAVKALRAGYD